MITMEENLNILRRQGREDAIALRAQAPELTGTQLMQKRECIPPFDPGRDYTGWPQGSAVTDEGQVWRLEIPHNAAHYPGLRPGQNRACWSLAHTRDPVAATAWVAPWGTSGLYSVGECCVWEGRPWRNLYEGNPYPPLTQGAEERWEAV